MPESIGGEDVIDVLHRQHDQVIAVFTALQTAAGGERATLYRELRRLLAAHRAAEEDVVHPAVRRIEGGAQVVDARRAEDDRARDLVGRLDSMGPGGEGFDSLLEQLHEDMVAHAEHEERRVFPLLRAHHDPESLHEMALRVAPENTAPQVFRGA